MGWCDFLKKFELSLITTLSDFFTGQFNCKHAEFATILSGFLESTSFKLNPGMSDFLLLRALERFVNLESEVELSDGVRHNLFKFLRTQKV